MSSQNTEDEAVRLECGFVTWQKRLVSQKDVKNVPEKFNVVRDLQVGSICIWMQYMSSGQGGGTPLLPLICSVARGIHCQDTNLCIGTALSPHFYHIALLVQWSWTAISNTANKKMCKHKQQPTLILVANLCTERLGRHGIIFHMTHLLSKHCTQY